MHLTPTRTSEQPRRFCAALLLTLFSLLLLWPAVGAATQQGKVVLPACCRMHGGHHCSGDSLATHRESHSTLSSVQAPCPCPSTAAPSHGTTLGAAPCGFTPMFFAASAVQRIGVYRAQRTERNDSNGKRGPPTAAPAA